MHVARFDCQWISLLSSSMRFHLVSYLKEVSSGHAVFDVHYLTLTVQCCEKLERAGLSYIQDSLCEVVHVNMSDIGECL